MKESENIILIVYLPQPPTQWVSMRWLCGFIYTTNIKASKCFDSNESTHSEKAFSSFPSASGVGENEIQEKIVDWARWYWSTCECFEQLSFIFIVQCRFSWFSIFLSFPPLSTPPIHPSTHDSILLYSMLVWINIWKLLDYLSSQGGLESSSSCSGKKTNESRGWTLVQCQVEFECLSLSLRHSMTKEARVLRVVKCTAIKLN